MRRVWSDCPSFPSEYISSCFYFIGLALVYNMIHCFWFFGTESACKSSGDCGIEFAKSFTSCRGRGIQRPYVVASFKEVVVSDDSGYHRSYFWIFSFADGFADVYWDGMGSFRGLRNTYEVSFSAEITRFSYSFEP